jgi:ACS family allantoate permease-like MFS transporter
MGISIPQLAYLLFEYPNNLALQRFPVGKWMVCFAPVGGLACSHSGALQSICIFIWSIALMAQAAATSFGGLFACRFILGVCEGAITPGYMIVTSMFYTRQEQTRRVGYWCKPSQKETTPLR